MGMNISSLPALMGLFDLAVNTYQHEKGLIGIDTGYRYVDKKPTEEYAVRVHFFDRDPDTLEKPSGGDEIQLLIYPLVKQPNPASIHSWSRYQSKLRPGFSFGCRHGRGSIGLLGRDTKVRNRPAMLSCQHLFLDCRGRSPRVYQPPDRNLVSRDIGFWQRRLSNSDAAIIHIKPKLRARSTSNRVIIGPYNKAITIKKLREVQIGDILMKAGSSTGITQAKVDGIGLYYPNTNGLPFSVPCFRLTPVKMADPAQRSIAARGDSGAIWFDPQSGEGVGLHIAGNVNKDVSAQFAYALHLKQVCDEIGFVPNP